MSLIKKLMSKPWETPGYIDNIEHEGESLPMADKKVGLWAFIFVMASVFGLFTVAYNMRIQLATDWVAIPKPSILWLNTALLILASIAFERAKHAAQSKQPSQIKLALTTGGVLTIAFLIGQYAAWQELQSSGYLLAGNPANAFFYLITGLHALHLLGGLAVWSRTTFKLLGGVEATQLRLSIELCAVYWHFLLVMWVVLFGLLLST